jgi:hypothetical protein
MQAVFLAGEEREAYLNGGPADDDRFIGVFAHELEHSGGHTAEDARGVARKLLPDILSYDPRQPASFPENGRTLTDDVADVFLSILTNRKVTGDKVGPHGDLLNGFPYLGSPHAAAARVSGSGACNLNLPRCRGRRGYDSGARE